MIMRCKYFFITAIILSALLLAGCRDPIKFIFRESPPKYAGGEEFSAEHRAMIKKHVEKSDAVYEGRIRNIRRGWVKSTNLKYALEIDVFKVVKGPNVKKTVVYVKNPRSEIGELLFPKINTAKIRFFLKKLNTGENEYRFFAEPNCEELGEDVEW